MTSEPPPAPVATELELGAWWEPWLERHGAGADPLPWRRRLIASTEPVTASDIQVVALRMAGLTPIEIAREMGRSRLNRTQVERLCIAVALRLACDEGGIDWGVSSDSDLGRRLVRDALPPYSTEVSLHEQFTAMWLEGRPLDEIRSVLSLSKSAAKRSSEKAPPRWDGRRVAYFMGWSRENHRLRLSTGHFPSPDGRDGHSNWWWPETIDDWAQAQNLQSCPACGARVAKLPQHTRKHTREGLQTE